MSSGVPLLNEYKQEFLSKRVPQTVFGGLKVKLGYDAPAYVYLNQALLFIIPWILGGVFTGLVGYDLLEDKTGIFIYGGLMCVYVILVNFISEMRKSKADTEPMVNNKAKNMLAEDDEIDFQACFGPETVGFVVPGKKFKINIVIHALLSGPLCGIGFWYLLPEIINDLYGNIVATIIIYALGWFTLCVAQYSLTVSAPPETANFRALDTWEITPLMRPFYCFMFFAVFLLARSYDEFQGVDEVLHCIFIFLPFLWLLGLLPPLTAFIPWIAEQGLIFLLGGSPMASDLRLFLMVVVSTGSYLIVYFIPHGLVTVVLMSVFGYLLSLDLGGLGSQLLTVCCASKRKANPMRDEGIGFLWKWGIMELLYHVVILGLAVAVAVVVNKFIAAEDIAKDLADYFAYGIMALLLIEVTLSEVQSVYVFFGLWRNKLYPSSVQRTTIFTKGKRKLNVIGYIRRFIMNWVSPILVVAFLSVSFNFDATDYNAEHILGLHRAYRWAWQSTQNSMLEVTIVKIISLATENSTWKSYGVGLQLLLVGFGRDRLAQILNKLYFYAMLLIWSWKDKKQRRKNSYLMISFNIMLFPLALAVIILTAAFAAPLLPLFTLPVFIMGFPRPHRFWPAEVGASANVCEDTVYYQHMAPQLAKAFRDGFSFGSLGEPSPGSHYLVRFQDRMAWTMVLERGYHYCTVSIKGLELQETSCHTTEAARIEDIFDVTFEKENGVPFCSWHPYPFDSLRPYDAATIKTYSDAQNVLTGVIDSPDTIQKAADGFPRCLLWVMLHHNYNRNKNNLRGEETNGSSRPPTASSIKSKSSGRPTSVKAWKRLSTHGSTPDVDEKAPNIGDVYDEWESQINFENTSGDKKTQGNDISRRPGTAESAKLKHRPQSAKSISDSIWSDDSIMFDSVDAKKNQKVNLVSGIASHQKNGLAPVENNYDDMPGVLSGDESETSKKKKKSKKKNKYQTNRGEDMDDTSLFGDSDFGLPAADIHQKPPARLPPLFGATTDNGPVRAEHGYSEVTTLESPVQYNSHYSKVLAPPGNWREIPIDSSALEKYSQNFPTEWYKHALQGLKLNVGDKPVDVTSQVVEDKVLENTYSKIVMACNAVVNTLGLGGVDLLQLGTGHIYKMYHGEIPWSMASSWITEDQEFLAVVTKAYRYSVKLAIEQVLMGDLSGDEELQEYMEEYDRDWYLGSEKDPLWAKSVQDGKPTLFSLGYNNVDNTYNSRTLTKQDMSVYIGSLNAEVVKGQWANLALELLYMTNDDEERYSIQAHPTILRNLTVQAADPPLGYPIYSSPPISIPTL